MANDQEIVQELRSMLTVTRQLLQAKNKELEAALKQRNDNRAEINRLNNENHRLCQDVMFAADRTEILRRLSKIAKHFDIIEKEVTRG